MNITFLGTGTSQGVPIVGCQCEVCTSINPKDKRLRCSMYIETENTTLIIDTGPDFRQQLLKYQITDVDAILFTHEHKDHIAGLDDIRPINFLQKEDMPLYGEQRVLDSIKREFHYAFAEKKYPGVPRLVTKPIKNEPFQVKGLNIIPIRAYHHKLPVFGFRINDFVYVTDANRIDDNEMEKLHGAEVLVINALRHKKHLSHFTVSEALSIIEKVQPKQAYLTHISHIMGLHEEENQKLPKHVSLAFDGLSLHL